MTTAAQNSSRAHPKPPKPGDVLLVDRTASVQFAGPNRLLFRVTRVQDRPQNDGWVWLTGYVLDGQGFATQQREIFVQVAGLRHIPAQQLRGSAR